MVNDGYWWLIIISGCWLTYPSEKWWSESQWGWDDIPYMKWKIKVMFETTNHACVGSYDPHYFANSPLSYRLHKKRRAICKHCHYVKLLNEPMEVRSSFRTDQKAMILLVAHKSHPRILSASEFSCNYTSIYIYTVIHDHHHWIIPI